MVFGLLVVGFYVVYSAAGKITAYGDGVAKTNNARRVLDNPLDTFSLAQLGSIWPVWQSVLNLPLVWNDFMYRTGLSGSVWSMAFYVTAAVLVYKLVVMVTNNRLAGLAAVAAASLNVNYVYFATTPMAESLVIFAAIACAYVLVRYEQSPSWDNLAVAGIVLAASTQVRYEFWAFLVLTAPLMWFALGRRGVLGWQRAGHILTLYLPVGTAVLAWMVLWEWALMGHPLYFATSRYSAKAIDVEPYNFSFVGDLQESARAYFTALRWNVPDVILVVALIGIIIYVTRIVLRRELTLAAGYLFGSPLFFITSLYLGQNAIDVDNPMPVNTRYATTALPLIAFGVGYLVAQVNKSNLRVPLFTRAIAVGIVSLVLALGVAQLREPLGATVLADRAAHTVPGQDEFAAWLAANYDGGGLLIESFGRNSTIQFYSGIPLREYISEVNPTLWDLALEDPANQVEWVVTRYHDQLDQELVKTPDFQEDFRVAFQNDYGVIYVARIRD
jgi:hypothetical protein